MSYLFVNFQSMSEKMLSGWMNVKMLKYFQHQRAQLDLFSSLCNERFEGKVSVPVTSQETKIAGVFNTQVIRQTGGKNKNNKQTIV